MCTGRKLICVAYYRIRLVSSQPAKRVPCKHRSLKRCRLLAVASDWSRANSQAKSSIRTSNGSVAGERRSSKRKRCANAKNGVESNGSAFRVRFCLFALSQLCRASDSWLSEAGCEKFRVSNPGRIAQPFFDFRPHRSGRADFPHPALHEGDPRHNRCLYPSSSNAGNWQGEAYCQGLELRPAHAPAFRLFWLRRLRCLASPRHCLTESAERWVVMRPAIIAVLPAQYGGKSPAVACDRPDRGLHSTSVAFARSTR